MMPTRSASPRPAEARLRCRNSSARCRHRERRRTACTRSSTSASASNIDTAAISIDFATNCTISCLRVAPSTLRSATSRARWLARAVARLVKFTTAMPRISIAIIAKVVIERRSLPGVIALSCALPRWTSSKLMKCQSSSVPWLYMTLPLGSSGMLRFSHAGICASSWRTSVPGCIFRYTQPDWQPQHLVRKFGLSALKAG